MTGRPGTDRMALAAAIHHVRRRWLAFAASRSAAIGLSVTTLLLAVAAALDRFGRIADGSALALAGLASAAVVGTVAALVWPFRHRPDDRRVARFIEERYPVCGDAIATAVDVSEREVPGDFARLVVSSATHTLSTLDLDGVVERRTVRFAALGLAGAGAACALAIVLAAPFLRHAADIVYVHLFPSSISVAVVPGDLRVPAGGRAIIQARVKGRHGSLAHVPASITLDASGQSITVPMEQDGDGYRFTVARVDRSFHYTVSAGPAVSRAYAVTALHPSRVERIDLQYDFPSFTGLQPRFERDGGDVYAPAGTRVRVIVHSDKPVRDGTLAFSQGRPPAPLARIDDRTLAASLTIDEESAYRVGLVDHDGLTSESVEYFVRVMDDRPPDVHILRPGNDEGITSLDEVPIEARADDDYGIRKMDLVYSVAGGPERVVPFTSLSGTELARVGAHTLAVEDLKVRPGDVIAYYARAWDVPRAKQSTMTRSEMFFLEVRPFNEEYSFAQSQAAMQAAIGTQLEGLISSQKEIISATWNLERRAGAGRSSTDVKGVADAQAELKERAERAAGTERRRFGQDPPQRWPAEAAGGQKAAAPQPAAPNDDPVRKAIDAMGRAAQQLQDQKTADALPHEMAALNALLQAQAAIREKQVTQQQSTGGNPFGNRQSQDLSTLFDRELKRQQKSNYENKAGVETQPEDAKRETALDKIRDLARRQEELSREQHELARGGMSAEDMKRQLEKLTRDQEALRRQLEETSRQQGGESTSQDVKDALARMRDAAAQGQKSDASGAATEAQQAAEALRRAEAQMQNGSPDARKRALGDLQLEAQQTAQEQRRIADETDRLTREQGGANDARRRLAHDKDQLADRVDAMQRAAERLPDGNAAARDLGAGQFANRMRSGAQQLRDGQVSDKTVRAEQQMADALDLVARKLGASDAGGAKGDSRQLAGDLDQIRDARDRITQLERQMRDLQSRLQPSPGADTQGRAGAGSIAELQRQLNEELARTRDLVNRLQRATSDSGGGMATPEEHEWSGSAPGTEAFKQDYAAWQSLARDVARALERAESSAASRLSTALSRDRLRAGGSDRVPDAYRRQVSRYFESIAVKQRPGRQ